MWEMSHFYGGGGGQGTVGFSDHFYGVFAVVFAKLAFVWARGFRFIFVENIQVKGCRKKPNFEHRIQVIFAS